MTYWFLLIVNLEAQQIRTSYYDEFQPVEGTLDLSGQESGTISTFGPATKEFYDAGQWGMVPVGNKHTPSVQEVYSEPSSSPTPAKSRLRLSDEYVP